MFELIGTDTQKAIIQGALDACGFDFKLLAAKLKADTGRDRIPVEWEDLGRYRMSVHGGHAHVHHEGQEAHVYLAPADRHRARALGLAWYSGKVSIDTSLEGTPELAKEVFLSEAAHMVDFFYMTDEQRQAIFTAYHSGSTDEHGHTWFDNPSYWADTGESFMAGFVSAYAPDIPVTIAGFDHPTTPEVAAAIRDILTPPLPGPGAFFALKGSKVFHRTDGHRLRLDGRVYFFDLFAATRGGFRPCKRCVGRT